MFDPRLFTPFALGALANLAWFLWAVYDICWKGRHNAPLELTEWQKFRHRLQKVRWKILPPITLLVGFATQLLAFVLAFSMGLYP